MSDWEDSEVPTTSKITNLRQKVKKEVGIEEEEPIFHYGTVTKRFNNYPRFNPIYRSYAPERRTFTRQYNKDYVEKLRTSFVKKQTEESVVRKREVLSTTTDDIIRRLMQYNYPCNMRTFSCLFDMCGRSFANIEVLAFHINYAHQDLNGTDTRNLTCLICGKQWTTVRTKILHVSSAHRELGEEHNAQCLQQVDPVIAPNSPMAIRLLKAKEEYEYVTELDETYDGVVTYSDDIQEELVDEEVEEGAESVIQYYE